MEKLIDLLNEYKKIKGYDGNTKITNYDTDTGSFTNGYSGLEYEIVIGKRYGFIKRLVENDKIRNDIYRPIPVSIQFNGEGGVQYFKKLEDRLLMPLAISKNPIKELISYLK